MPDLSTLKRSAIFTALIGSAITFGLIACDSLDEPWRQATRAALIYLSTALGVVLDSRKVKPNA